MVSNTTSVSFKDAGGVEAKKGYDLQRREARKTDGIKAPESLGEVSKLVADVLPAFVNLLEQEIDDDVG